MANDFRLLQIVDQALADTTVRSGSWLVCKPGCSQCCHGTFAINALDSERLRVGLAALNGSDPARAAAIEARVARYIAETLADFPGDPRSGALGEDEASQEAFEDFANDLPCPVLDPATQTCDLYSSRPMTCRVFGPPVRSDGGLGVCELCYVGATPEEIAACEMIPDPESLEANLLASALVSNGCNEVAHITTIVGYALAARALDRK